MLKVNENSQVNAPNYQTEIERKFLIRNELPPLSNGEEIRQTYLFIDEGKELRLRIHNSKCKMSIKITLDDVSREEYEYSIPIEEGLRLMRLASNRSPIEKIRYNLPYDNMNWEIDVFKGENEGLVIAEVELTHPKQQFIKPSWVGEEVTHDRRYYNVNIYQNPYKYWKKFKELII